MAPGTITNQASVGANEADPNAGDNSVSTETTVVDVIRTTPLGLENPLSAGREFVNGEVACPEMASSSSISFDVDIPAGASFIEFDYAFSGADEGDYGTVFLDVLRPSPSGQARASCKEAQHGTTGLPLPRALSPCCHPRAPRQKVAFRAQDLFRCPTPRQGAGP